MRDKCIKPAAIPQPTTNRLLLTVAEACRLLSLSRTTVYKLRGQGLLEDVFIGGAVRITSDSVARLASGSFGELANQ